MMGSFGKGSVGMAEVLPSFMPIAVVMPIAAMFPFRDDEAADGQGEQSEAEDHPAGRKKDAVRFHGSLHERKSAAGMLSLVA